MRRPSWDNSSFSLHDSSRHRRALGALVGNELLQSESRLGPNGGPIELCDRTRERSKSTSKDRDRSKTDSRGRSKAARRQLEEGELESKAREQSQSHSLSPGALSWHQASRKWLGPMEYGCIFLQIRRILGFNYFQVIPWE